MLFPAARSVFQQAWVVNDLEASARQWSTSLGIGPFYLATYQADRFEDVVYRGAPGTQQMRTAICYAGLVQIELIERIGNQPNCYTDTVPVGREGFHHICVWTFDLDADIRRHAQMGHEVATRGRMRGGPAFAYVDAVRSIGCMIELLEHSVALENVFNGWRDNCANWTGGELFIRR
jgi:hypothetical protein